MKLRNCPDDLAKDHDIARIRELALSAVPQSVIVIDASLPNHPIIYANDAFCQLTGYTAEEIVGQGCEVLGGPETSEETKAEAWSAVAAKRRYRGLILNYRKDGTPFWNDLTLVPLEDRGRCYYVGVQNDVTDRILLEASLRESQKMEALGKLSGGMAHDFNNILALIMGNAEIIAAEDVSPLVSEAARDIVESADSGSELVRRMLQFAGGHAAPTEVVDVNHLIKNVVMMLGRTMAETVTFVTDLSEKVGGVQADKTMFRTALLNLALNARDAMPDGGTIRIATRRRAHPTPGVEDGVVITVGDTGTGMSKATRERAFEPFFTTKQAGRGTGLGLSMVYRFATGVGGNVTIVSKPGKGTTIGLLLPRYAPAPPAAEPRVVERERILVVEDDAKMRKLLVQQLQRAGYMIDDAADAAEALELIEGGGDHRLVISDIRLGAGMSGIELVAAIRAHRPGIPVLLITAYSEDLEHAASHVDGVPILRKPFRTKELLEKVEQMMAGMMIAPARGAI